MTDWPRAWRQHELVKTQLDQALARIAELEYFEDECGHLRDEVAALRAELHDLQQERK